MALDEAGRRVLEATRRKLKDGSTHWSCRKLARELGVSKDTVHRIWRIAGVKPHRLERYMTSDDPDFETKAAKYYRALSASHANLGATLGVLVKIATGISHRPSLPPTQD